MDKEEKIKNLISLLTKEELKEDILKISPDRKPVLEFLDSVGELSITYKNTNAPKLGHYHEIGGHVNLWEKHGNEWTILVWQINKFFPHIND